MLLVVGVLLLPWAAIGAPPTVTIKATTTDTITPGDIAVFDADVTLPTPVDGKPDDVRVRWFVEPELFADGKPTFLVLDAATGKLPRLQVATRSGRLRVELVAVVGGEIGRVVKDVVIAGSVPTPNPQPQPQPQPTPQPQPPSVNEKHGFISLIRAKSPSVTTHRAAAGKIAGIYGYAASVGKVAASNPTDPKVTQIVGLLNKARGVEVDLSRGVDLLVLSSISRSLVGAEISKEEHEAWRDVMRSVEAAVKLKVVDVETCSECYSEIATALGEVK